MRVFQQKTAVQRFASAEEFARQYDLGEGDFILASRSIYERYFGPLGLKAHVAYKSSYGSGEPTDIMIDRSEERRVGKECRL